MRWIFRILGALVALVLIAVGALFLLPADRIASVAAERIGQATGRTVEITGDVSPTIWPHLGVRASGFTVGNPDWVTDGPLITAEALSVRVPWSSVFSGAIEVEEIALQAPRITLVRAADGRASWVFDAPEATAASQAGDTGDAGDAGDDGGTASTGFALDRAIVEDGQVLFLDAMTGQRFEIDALDAEVALPRSAHATLTANARVNGASLGVSARIDDLDGLLDGGLRSVDVTLEWQGGEVSFAGDVSLDAVLEGALAASATDLGPIFALLGQPAPTLPAGLGQDRLSLETEVTLTGEGTAHLRDAILDLDDNRLTFALDVTPGDERPMIRGTVRSEEIVLPQTADSGTGGSTGSGTAGAGGDGAGWSREPIDVSGLFAADVEIAARVASVSVGALGLDDLDLRLTNTDGRAVLDIERIGLYGGTLAGAVVVNGRGGLSARSDLFLVDVELSPLLDAVAGYDRLEGRGSASLDVLAVGNDMDTLMRSLEGQGDLALGAGAINGLDIAGMIRTLDASYQGEGARTLFDSLTANFEITNGVMRNEDLRLDAPWGGATGAGSVDMGGQTLDYRLIPGVLRDDTGAAEIEVPILISGPWAQPSIRLDLEYLAEQRLAEQAARLEAEAEARLAEEADRLEAEAREQINDALNLGLEEGDTVEDAEEALEERLREEAGNALRGLFGGN